MRAADEKGVWWAWVVGGLVAWFTLAALASLLIGRGIRLADRRELATDDVLTTAHLPAGWGQPAPVASAPVRRRAIPLPPIGVGLALLAVAFETCGFLLRLTGHEIRALSMDAPLSLPRMYVTALFAAATLAAVGGSAVLPVRRTWWGAVGIIAAAIAVVKAGGTFHAAALHALSEALGATAAQLLSALLAAVVVAGLWFLSRAERRDRRRILGALAAYAVAAVGLSAISSAVPETWTAAATYVEESGEALAAVAFLIAVLAGVAPRMVLPEGWPLRRAADAQTLDAPQTLPGRRNAPGRTHRA